MKFGIISDTHDFLDPRVKDLFAGVDHILHAGDVGSAWITFELEQIAPVTAVLGNTDLGLQLKETEVVELAGAKFLVHHIVNPHEPDDGLQHKITKAGPQFVIFGHTHRAFDQVVNGIRYFNPGYSGKPKHGTARSVALLHCEDRGIRAEFVSL